MMELYILRHAIAVARGTPGYPNDDRPLTPEGVEKMKRAAKGIARILSGIDVILTSPLERAHHTATIVARALDAQKKIKIVQELLPGRTAQELSAVLAELGEKTKIMLVGHEPGLGRFASSLLGNQAATVIEFRKGALCRIDIASLPSKRSGQVIFHLPPKYLRALAG